VYTREKRRNRLFVVVIRKKDKTIGMIKGNTREKGPLIIDQREKKGTERA